jgi:hypothetical protein
MDFGPSSQGFITDMIHMMAAYLITPASASTQEFSQDFVFPGLSDLMGGGVAGKITHILHTLAKHGKVEGLTMDHTAHGM